MGIPDWIKRSPPPCIVFKIIAGCNNQKIFYKQKNRVNQIDDVRTEHKRTTEGLANRVVVKTTITPHTQTTTKRTKKAGQLKNPFLPTKLLVTSSNTQTGQIFQQKIQHQHRFNNTPERSVITNAFAFHMTRDVNIVDARCSSTNRHPGH